MFQHAKDEDFPIDTWQTNYRMRKARDRGGIPVTKGVMDDKALFRALGGIPPVDKKLAQFLLNDRKVLRFKAGFWALRHDTTSPDNYLIAPLLHK